VFDSSIVNQAPLSIDNTKGAIAEATLLQSIHLMGGNPILNRAFEASHDKAWPSTAWASRSPRRQCGAGRARRAARS
jgi:hypothetical protein